MPDNLNILAALVRRLSRIRTVDQKCGGHSRGQSYITTHRGIRDNYHQLSFQNEELEYGARTNRHLADFFHALNYSALVPLALTILCAKVAFCQKAQFFSGSDNGGFVEKLKNRYPGFSIGEPEVS